MLEEEEVYLNNFFDLVNFTYSFNPKFPANRGLSRRGKNERRERPLPASDAFPITHALAFP